MAGTTDDVRGPRYDLRRSRRAPGGRTRLTVYLTTEERQELETRATVTGEAMAKLLVDAALHRTAADEAGQGTAELVRLLRSYRRQLVGVTTNLNQVAYHANTVSEVPADLDAVVAQVRRLRDDITDIIDEALSEVGR